MRMAQCRSFDDHRAEQPIRVSPGSQMARGWVVPFCLATPCRRACPGPKFGRRHKHGGAGDATQKPSRGRTYKRTIAARTQISKGGRAREMDAHPRGYMGGRLFAVSRGSLAFSSVPGWRRNPPPGDFPQWHPFNASSHTTTAARISVSGSLIHGQLKENTHDQKAGADPTLMNNCLPA